MKKPRADNEFRAPDFVRHTNIYEVNLRQFTPAGTINAFRPELRRLRDMGVETLWFMPITPIAQKNRKGSLGSYYACSDYVSVNAEFGTLEDFRELVREAHELGMKVILDWVANHTGWDHVWTRSHPGYYLTDSVTGEFQIASGMDDIIELNYANPALRRAMIEAMAFWVKECDIDGFRCDLAHWVEKDFWEQARAQLDEMKPLFWFGEFDELSNPEYGEVFDASYTWTWMHETREFFQERRKIDSLWKVLKGYDDLQSQCVRTWFTTNHDENSWNGTEYEKYGDMARALAVFSCTWDGIPLIYSGQELPNRKRLRFFDKDTISWTGQNELHGFYKALLQVHSSHPALAAGDAQVQTFRIRTTAEHAIFSFLRKKGNAEVLVVLNLSPETLRFDIADEKVTGTFKNIFSGAANDFTTEKSFQVQGWEYLVYEKR
ncbi:MAG TPA: alpha-amylase family glycosyl hydrolase [Chitinophagaceae bacterium]|nr:alpha-amylase family glycosyl hydrolase [Chitinophagaceae bacterium]